MGIMVKLAAVALVLGVFAGSAFCQKIRLPVGFPNLMKNPPNPNANINRNANSDALAKLRDRLFGNDGKLSINLCNLNRVPPFKDPSIKTTIVPGARNPALSSTMVRMALNRAVQQGGPQAARARALQEAEKPIMASKARAAARAKRSAESRQKRQAADVETLAETVTTELCRPREKLIYMVENERDRCYTIGPQEVKYWECASPYPNGMSNNHPTMQAYRCEPMDYAYTSWFVICPFARDRNNMVRLHSAPVPLNCACLRYKCDFEPYFSDSPRKF